MLLRVSDLWVSYPAGPALRGCSFDLDAAQALALVGASGSGKTTVARALLGLLPEEARQTGEIAWSQDWPRDRSVRARGLHAGWIPQEPSAALNPRLTAAAHIRECLRAAGEPRSPARTEQLLEAVGLNPGRGGDYPHQWSGGMQQRLLIAMALAPRPALLIADEATSALDAQTQAAVMDLLARLRVEQGVAMLWITHDLAVAAQLADQILVLERGETVEQGSARQVLRSPRHACTQRLVASQPPWEAMA